MIILIQYLFNFFCAVFGLVYIWSFEWKPKFPIIHDRRTPYPNPFA
jgi:hypothetical protein